MAHLRSIEAPMASCYPLNIDETTPVMFQVINVLECLGL